MPTYEMFWDCPACGSTELLGKTHRHCPNCGHPQDASYRYFPAEDKKVLAQDHVFVGVDWTCDRCESPNSAAAAFCVNCGDARDADDGHVERLDSVVAGSQSGVLDDDEDPAPVEEDWQPKRRGRGIWVLLAVAVLLCAGGGAAFALLYSAPTSAEVVSHRWERQVRIDRMMAVSDGAWCDSMPGDAYSVSRSERQRSTRQIPDGQSCHTVNNDNGDGTFSTQEVCSTNYRSEPVYDTWCSYTVDRFRHDRTEKASGASRSPEPSWPSYSVTEGRSLGSTRVAGRTESYYVALVDVDGTQHECDYKQARWASMDVGGHWTGKKRVLLDSLVCDGLVEQEAP